MHENLNSVDEGHIQEGGPAVAANIWTVVLDTTHLQVLDIQTVTELCDQLDRPWITRGTRRSLFLIPAVRGELRQKSKDVKSV